MTSETRLLAVPTDPKQAEVYFDSLVERELWMWADAGNVDKLEEHLAKHFKEIQPEICEKIAGLAVKKDADSVAGAVLYAVDAGDTKLTSLLLRRVKRNGWSEKRRSSQFRILKRNISPLIVACINNNFDMVAVLLSRGHTLPAPHNMKCVCDECVKWRRRDQLDRSHYIMKLNQAVCSDAFLWLACPDPISAGAKMAYELERQAHDNPEFNKPLAALSNECSSFCGTIASLLQTSTEIDLLLKCMEPMNFTQRFMYPGLELTIDCHVKHFLADPTVNGHIRGLWEGNLRHNTLQLWLNFFTHVFYMFTVPVYAISGGNVFKTYQIPYYRYVSHLTSYLIFLCCLVGVMQNDPDHKNVAGWSTSTWRLIGQWYIWLYVFGCVATDMQSVSSGTLSKFLEAWWHWLNFLDLGLHMISFYIWMRSQLATEYLREVDRSHWCWWEPFLLFEATFSFANMLSFWRLFYYFQLSKIFGPLIISVGRCVRPILIHITIILMYTVAFSVAVNNLYENYEGNTVVQPTGDIDKNPDLFNSVGETARWLYWTFYGYLPPTDMRIVVGNVGKLNNVTEHHIGAMTGEFLIGLYYAVTIIVLLNLLIAMMTGVASNIAENEDREWMWERAYIWHEYMHSHFTLPPPFNIPHIITVNVMRYIGKLMKTDKDMQRYYNENRQDYEKLMNELLIRYLRAKNITMDKIDNPSI